MIVLNMFDYLVDTPNAQKRHYSKEVVFAGNLDKSGFLHKGSAPEGGVLLNVYGKEPETEMDSNWQVYKGKFEAGDISSIEGSWGLVWDGESIDCLSGKMGEYLKYNYPHKTSLYVCAGLPVIVPRSSAVANIVLQENIGIAISSISDISEEIEKVSEKEYCQMCANLKTIAKKLACGGFLMEAIDKSK